MTIAATRVLGIDPGLNITGYGVVDYAATGDVALVEAGILRGGDAKLELGQRLKSLGDGLADVIASLHPTVVACEQLYSHYQRPQTAILMGHARGVLCMTAAQAELRTFHYSATQIKRVLTGNGRAPKSQMQLAISRHLHLEQVPEPPDVADALAVALCHCYLAEVKSRGGRPQQQPVEKTP